MRVEIFAENCIFNTKICFTLFSLDRSVPVVFQSQPYFAIMAVKTLCKLRFIVDYGDFLSCLNLLLRLIDFKIN